MAQKIAKICAAEKVSFIFKASYDKANRTSVKSFRGIDARAGCELLASIGRELKIPVTTDVHSPAEAEIAGELIDLLQIPAFLCRQTDLLRATATSHLCWRARPWQPDATVFLWKCTRIRHTPYPMVQTNCP